MIYEYSQGETSFETSPSNILLFEIILLNITHNAFTLAMLGMPELKEWRANNSVTKLLGVFILMWGSFQALLMSLNSVIANDIFFLISLIFPVHHALSQSYGLSLLYNKNGDTEVKKAESLERKFYQFFLLAIICSLFVETLPLRYMLDIPYSIKTNTQNFFRYTVFTGFILIMIQTFRMSHKVKYKKIMFAARYFVWACVMISPAAASGTKAIHGLEYALVTRKIFGNSRDSKKWILLAVLSFVVAGLFWFRYSYFRMSGTISSLASLSLAITFFHYYLDRKLFRMRHAINRETVGKLLR